MEAEYIIYTPNFGKQEITTLPNNPNILEDNYSREKYTERAIEEISQKLQVFALRLPYGFTDKPRTQGSLRESYYFTVAGTPQDAVDKAYQIRGYWMKGRRGTRIQSISRLHPDEVKELLTVITYTPEVCIPQFMTDGFFGRRKDGTEVYVYADQDGQTRVAVSCNHPYSQYSRRSLTTYRR